ncbi:hypothetical protein HY642_03660 [Candidatus Woesearchaeota archaeon]|nr:hypothetical protein [Candidatus Woesearchaeota archaeon]
MATLAEWIAEQLKHGVPVNDLRANLISRGYPQVEVDEAIEQALRGTPPKRIPWALLVVVLVAITAGGLYFGLQFMAPAAPPALTLSVDTPEAAAGDKVRFSYRISSAATRDMTMLHQLLLGDQVVASAQENLAGIEDASRTYQLTVPASAKPGSYTLKTLLRYDSSEVQDSGSVFIKAVKPPEKPTPEKVIPPESPVPNETIAPEQPPQPPAPGITVDIDAIIARGKSDVQVGRVDCLALQLQNNTDNCLSRLSHATNQTAMCEPIKAVAVRDGCYFSRGLDGSYQVCELIVGESTRRTCEALRALAT